MKYNLNLPSTLLSLETDLATFSQRVRALIGATTYINNPLKTTPPFNPVYFIQKKEHTFLPESYNATIEDYLREKRHELLNTFQSLPTRFNAKNHYHLLSEWYIANDIIIKNTDKNLGVAVIGIQDYHSKAMLLLNDTNTYAKVLNFDLSTIRILYESTALKLIRATKKMTLQETKFLIHASLQCNFDSHCLPHLHIIPKVHKSPWVGRPIISSMKWIFRNLSIYLNQQLLLIAKKIPTIIKDSKEIILLLEGVQVTNESFFFSLDAISMYTNIPLDKVFTIMRRFPDTYPTSLIEALETTCKNNYFTYLNQVYLQTDGLPMGVNFAVPFADISIFLIFEINPHLIKFQKHIRFWGRYLDDCNGLWQGTKTEFLEFVNTMNHIDTKLKWTIGTFDKFAVYLDLIAKIDSNNIIYFELYQKSLNKYQYLHYQSTHSNATKKGWIKGELIRLCRNCTYIHTFQKNVILFYNRLLKRGYREHFIQPIFDSFLFSNRLDYLKLTEMDESLTPVTNMEFFFYRMRKGFIIDAQTRFTTLEVIPKAKILPFTTSFSTTTPYLKLPKIYKILPAFLHEGKEIMETQITISHKITNRIGKAFSNQINTNKLQKFLGEENNAN